MKKATGYYDRSGKPIEDWDEVQRLLTHPTYRRVAWTDLPGGGFLSTVWLGLDHRIWGDGPPLIFESMRFPEQDHTQRYSTEEEARAGHDALVALILGEQNALN